MIDNRLFEILACKPDLIKDFPEWMLPPAIIHELRETENLAVAEIAGRDSIAAVLRACELRRIRAIVPTVAYTGTEYGNWTITFEKINILKDKLQKDNIRVFDPVVIGSPKFWWKLCGRYTTHLTKKYGFYSHCVGCHFYFHAVRIPLAKKIHSTIVIGGERESHNGKLKVNQIKISLDAYQSFLKKFGIELYLPIRYVKSGQEIESILNMPWDEGDQQLECVLSKNYLEADGSVSFREEAIIQYFEEFAFQTAEEIIKKYLSI
jgi:hypothetical protein